MNPSPILTAQDLPERRPLDKYRTPPFATQALIESYPELFGDALIDPCAGDCRMPKALVDAGRFPLEFTNDIDETEPTDLHEDSTQASFWSLLRGKFQGRVWVVTNPPFLQASSIAYQAIQTIGNVALLLRATWLEPTEDRQWLGRFPPKSELVLPRFSFGVGATDSTGCRWLLWGDVEPGIKVYTKKPGQLDLLGEHGNEERG